MSVSKDDALSALHDIESAKRRSQTLFGYGLASPHLLLWGTLWIVAGLVGALSPANTGIGWCAVDVVGVLGSGWLVARHARRCGERGERVRLFRYVGSVAVLAAFITLTLMVFAPASGDEVLMLFTLVVARAIPSPGAGWVCAMPPWAWPLPDSPSGSSSSRRLTCR